MKRIAAYTLGCKVNQYDTEAMLESFERAGYLPVPFHEDAEVYLINTCTVTGTGDQKSLKTVRRVAREHPESAIIVSGCLAQREAESICEMDNVRLVIGVQRRSEVVSLFQQAMTEDTVINAVAELKGADFEGLFVSRHEGKNRATMKIQEGCDRYCSYCIIPSVRGPVRSMPLQSVREEAQRIAASGYREIVMTGIHLASYGRGTEFGLGDAIDAVHSTPGIERVRIGSLEPMIVDEAFAHRLAAFPGLARQFHLSMQSGSAGVLKRMNRRYTPEQYYSACCRLREAMPGCAITTDVIAGFPGESEAEFMETVQFVEKCRFARIHVFPYSRRSGTAADRMDGQLSMSKKKERALRLIEIGNKLEQEYVSSMIGSVRRVLFEQTVGNGMAEGYTGEYVRVRAPADSGDFVFVRIVGCEGTLALGEPLQWTGGETDGLSVL